MLTRKPAERPQEARPTREEAAAKKPKPREAEAAAAKKEEQTMAHKKGLGSSRNGRDSNPKMLGVKVFAGQKVTGGEIIVRQRGTRFRPGDGVGLGRDHTIFATRPGVGAVQHRPPRPHDLGRRSRVASRENPCLSAGPC